MSRSRLLFFFVAALILYGCARSFQPRPQSPTTAEVWPETALSQDRLAADLRFLASDELMGRRAGTVYADVAARYIAEQRGKTGLDPILVAAAYNAVAIPVALSGHATPIMAALAMSASSICVSLNALRLR